MALSPYLTPQQRQFVQAQMGYNRAKAIGGQIGGKIRGAVAGVKSVYNSPMVRSGFSSLKAGGASYLGSAMHARGIKGGLESYGLGKGMGLAGRAIGFGFLGLNLYQGYQQGGVAGAAFGAAKGFAEGYAFNAILGAAAMPVALGVGLGVGALKAHKWAADKGQRYAKALRATEFGAGVSDQFGTVATMRRRSVMALNESRIGGGMGMGNEAMRQYQPYFR